MNLRRIIYLSLGVACFAAAIYLVYPYFIPDRVLMWETTALRSGNGRASTERAQAAAKRCFDRVKLHGKTREEIIELVGDPKQSNNSMYNFPFYPVTKEVLVYRFDTGAYGWQFNIYFDAQGKAVRIESLGID